MTDEQASARAATMAKLTDAVMPGVSQSMPDPFEIQAQRVAGELRLAGWVMTNFETTAAGAVNMTFRVSGPVRDKDVAVTVTAATFANETPTDFAARMVKDNA